MTKLHMQIRDELILALARRAEADEQISRGRAMLDALARVEAKVDELTERVDQKAAEASA